MRVAEPMGQYEFVVRQTTTAEPTSLGSDKLLRKPCPKKHLFGTLAAAQRSFEQLAGNPQHLVARDKTE